MRAQQVLTLSGLVLAGNIAIAAKLEQDDVPNCCWDSCSSVVGVSRRCDNQNDNDSAELQCICTWDAAKTQIPLCAACITQYGNRDNDHDDDNDNDDNGKIISQITILLMPHTNEHFRSPGHRPLLQLQHDYLQCFRGHDSECLGHRYY